MLRWLRSPVIAYLLSSILLSQSPNPKSCPWPSGNPSPSSARSHCPQPLCTLALFLLTLLTSPSPAAFTGGSGEWISCLFIAASTSYFSFESQLSRRYWPSFLPAAVIPLYSGDSPSFLKVFSHWLTAILSKISLFYICSNSNVHADYLSAL